MAGIYQRGKKNTFYITYYVNGKRRYKSLKTSDPKIARVLRKEYEVKLERGLNRESRQKPIDDFLNEYVEATSHRKRVTNRNELYTIKMFLGACKKKTVNGISETDIRVFMKRYDDKAGRTFNDDLASLKRFFKKAVESGYVLKNPCDGIRFKKIPQSLPHFFTDEEYLKIEECAEGLPIYPMIVTARYTGLRLAELIHLEWQDFDWDRKLVRVLNKEKYGHSVKNYQVRVVPVSDELRDKLLNFIKKAGPCFPIPFGKNAGGMYSEAGPKRALKTVLQRAGIKSDRRIGWHEFRHTFASRLVQNNVPIYKVSKWLGHSSLEVTQIYAHFAPVYDEDIEKLAIEKEHNFELNASLTKAENIQKFATKI